MISIFAQAIFTLIIVIFLAYAALELRLIFLSKKSQRVPLLEIQSSIEGGVDPDLNPKASPPSSKLLNEEKWPIVTVLLPVYNESKVIEALIDAVCAMQYPRSRFQVLVLDDSTDETTQLASLKVQQYAKLGIDISVIKRKKRTNYKAGNLANGLLFSTGEFLALFDADFLPPVNFLVECIPCFESQEVGYLQTGIGYINRDHSFLTRFQAMMLGHQQFVTSGLSYEKLMGALSGSSCVWRRTCVDSLGGWCGSTVAEDADIGYRAQFGRWQYVFVRHVVSLSELSESMEAIRIQRHRWARGLIHNAFKHLSSFLATGMPLLKRMHAFSLIFSSLLLAAIYVLVLLSLPLAIYANHLGLYFDFICGSFLLGVIVWASSNFIGAQQANNDVMGKSFISKLISMVMYVAMFFPLSLYYFYAGIELIFTKEYEFKRTPKGASSQLNRIKEEGKGGEVHSLSRVLNLLEYFSFFYSVASLGLAIYYQSYWLIPFNAMICLGFGIVIYYSYLENRNHASAT